MATKTAMKSQVKEPEAKKQTMAVTAIVTQAKTIIPAHLQVALADSQGRGVSMSRDDTIIPMAFVFQKGHSQVDERADEYIEGAKAGEIWLKGSVTPVRDGAKGVLFQPVAFQKVWVEWKPARGGFVTRHLTRPPDAEEKEILDDQGRPKIAWIRANNNLVVETREHYGFFLNNDDSAEPYMIPMSSTQHTVSRQWMSLMGQFKGPNGKPLDSFAKVYRLTTVRREKEGNNWYVFKVDDERWASVPEYERAVAFHDAIMSGEKKAEDYEATTAHAEESVGDDREI